MLSSSDNILTGEHMYSDNIPRISELEKKMLLTLAEKGPMCGYDFHLGGSRQRGSREAMMGSGSWNKIKKHLGKEGENLITVIWSRNRTASDERGRRKDLVWLTPEGVMFALNNDVNSRLLLKWTKETYPENPEVSLAVEVAQLGGKELTRASYLLNTRQYSQLDPSALLSMISKSRNEKERAEGQRKLMQLLKKYPEFKKDFHTRMRDMRKTLNSVLDAYEETEKKREEI
jgi:hypothetical protein